MADDRLHVALGPELTGRLRAFAAATGSEVDAVIRQAVASYVDDWSETLQRLADYDRTGDSLGATAVIADFRAAVAGRRTALD